MWVIGLPGTKMASRLLAAAVAEIGIRVATCARRQVIEHDEPRFDG